MEPSSGWLQPGRGDRERRCLPRRPRGRIARVPESQERPLTARPYLARIACGLAAVLLLGAACGDDSPEGSRPDDKRIPTATLPATLPEPRIIIGELTPEAPAPAETPAVDVTAGAGDTTPDASDTTPASRPQTYTVKSGDIPQTIAARFDVTVEALLAVNPGLDTRALQVGQVLNIPPPTED